MPATADETRLADILAESKSLMAEGGDWDKSKTQKLEENSAHAQELMAKIKASRGLDDVEDWSSKSRGGVPLVNADPNKVGESSGTPGEVKLEAVTQDGFAEIKTEPTKNGGVRFEVYDEYPMMDKKMLDMTSSRSYKLAFKEYIRKPREGMSGEAIKLLQEGVDTSGGFLVPEDILAAIIQKQPTPTNVQGRVRQLQTMRDNLIIPRVNYTTDDLYTTGIRATWTGEVPASATAMRVTEPIFGQTRIPVFTAMMSMPITNDMIEDAAFPLVSWASDKFAETIQLLKDNVILNGTGIGQPSGILVNPGAAFQPAVVTSGQTSSITSDALEATAFALPPQYDDNAAFVFNKLSTAKTIAQMKDGNGRYIWGAGLQDSGMVPGWKDRKLWGYDVVYNEFMPAIGASTYPAIFGDLTGYYLLNRIGFSMQILRELYAETNQILMLGRIRFGGQVAEDWKLKTLQCHV